MKEKRFALFLITSVLLFTLCLGGCARKITACPFSDLRWDATEEELIEVQSLDTTESLYGGNSYTGYRDYLGNSGVIKYHFNTDQELAAISWSFEGEPEEVDAVFTQLVQATNKYLGRNTGVDTTGVNNFGRVWETEDIKAVVAVVTSSDYNAVQILYTVNGR